jgi:hypothetical protein
MIAAQRRGGRYLYQYGANFGGSFKFLLPLCKLHSVQRSWKLVGSFDPDIARGMI